MVTTDTWTFLRPRYITEWVEVPYLRVLLRRNGAIHLSRRRMTLCGRVWGLRRDDPQPTITKQEPTCQRCRLIARKEQEREGRYRNRNGA